MLSASHNPMPDNGIKFFARGGVKLDDAIEDRHREAAARAVGPAHRRRRRPGLDVRRRGRATTPPHLVSTVDRPLAGHQGRPRLRPRRRLRRRPARAARRRRRGGGDLRRARRPEHQRRLRLDPPRRRCSARCSSTAPTPASRSTATPTAAWPSTHEGNVVDGDQLLAILALAMRDAGTLQGRHRRGDGDEQPRASCRRCGAERRRGAADQGRRPLRARGDEGARLHPRRRAVRARDHERPRHDRRRHPHRAARAGPDGRAAAARWPTWPA